VRFYPDIPSRRVSTLARDLLVAVLLFLFAWLGLLVHDVVDKLAVLGEGVQGAGSAVQGGFDAAADKVGGTPFVGDELEEGLRDAGEGTGGNVQDLGQQGEDAVHRLALVLGLLMFGIPAILVLFRYLPGRISQIRQLTAAFRVLAAPGELERRRLIAMRAAFSLPYGQLLQYTRDPLGDLAAERYDPLVAAALEDAGLRPPKSSRTPAEGWE
jgi:hypothetical protein